MIWKSNRLDDVARAYQKKLEPLYGALESKALVWVLFEDLLSIPKVRALAEPGLLLRESEMLRIHHAAKKLLRHVPVQHITGKAYFYGRSFSVNANVLIPRQETEELLSLALNAFKKHENPLILDIGTGSGCLAVSLALELPQSEVFALDVSIGALKTAAGNAKKMGARISFFQDDVRSPDYQKYPPKLDLIISNPPYVLPSEKAVMPENVKNAEPEMALYAPQDDPLLFYREIATLALNVLKENGLLLFEINESMGMQMLDLLIELGYANPALLKDLNGKDRFVRAIRDASLGQ